MFILLNGLTVAVLFIVMLALQELGRWLGERDRQHRSDIRQTAAEGAVYGMLGLFLAFTFSGAGARFEARRHLIVDEANAIGTAWLRIDLLPPNNQPHLRDLFRQYVDARLNSYRPPTGDPASIAKATGLQEQIWSTAVDAAQASGQVPPLTVLLPALNEMIDIATTRQEVRRLHPPTAVFVLLGVLTLMGALFAGYGMAGSRRRWLQSLGFATVLTITIFVIVDFEFPRLGLIRIDTADSVLVDLRRSMN